MPPFRAHCLRPSRFLCQLLRCRNVVATVDDATTRVLASWFQCEEPATVKLLLRVAETFALHGNMVRRRAAPSGRHPVGARMRAWSPGDRGPDPRAGPNRHGNPWTVPPQTRQLGLLQPYVLNCCHSENGEVVTETFLVLRCLVEHLAWQKLPSFLVQLAFTLGPFFEAVGPPHPHPTAHGPALGGWENGGAGRAGELGGVTWKALLAWPGCRSVGAFVLSFFFF